MKFIKFFTRITLFAVVPLLAIDGLRKVDIAFDPRAGNAYLATFIDKMHLLDSVPSPRLILMSGSSMAFGVDSDLLSKELEIPVVNAALHFNLGSQFMMQQLKATVKKGDIVLITLEYITTSKGKYEEQLIISDFYSPARKWIHFESFSEELSAYAVHRLSDCRLLVGETWSGTRRKPISIEDTTSVFFRKCFAKNGDLIGHLNNPQPTFPNPELSTELEFSKQIQDLNDFYTFAKQNGVTVFYTFPSYTEGGFEKNMPVVKKIEQQIRKNLKFPILGSPENSVMDDIFFFDSVYHPNAQGRKIFTSRLIQLLEQEGM
ncbi:MAG: hypothetical protein V4585_10015 [Bacteroidota bacterium]